MKMIKFDQIVYGIRLLDYLHNFIDYYEYWQRPGVYEQLNTFRETKCPELLTRPLESTFIMSVSNIKFTLESRLCAEFSTV